MTCPICKAPVQAAHRPFCSARCANLDLHRWLSGRYVITAMPDDDDDEPSDPGQSLHA